MSQNNLDYPEHLNPFKSRRGSITRSFRKVFRSFTGKDKQKPHEHDIRQHRHTAQPVPTSQSPQNRQTAHLPTALPRSRFKERLEKTESLKRTSKERHWYNEEHNAANPFEEEGAQKVPTGAGQAPIPAVRTKFRRRKKRTAPLPPGTTSSDGQYLDIPSRNGSKWSLTSTETDASSICYSEYDEMEKTQEEDHNEKSIEILEITRKIAEFTDDANNNVTASQIKKDDSTTLQEDPLVTSNEKNKPDESEEQKIVIEEVDAKVVVEEVDAKVVVEEVDANVVVEEVDAKVVVEEEKEKLFAEENKEAGKQDEENTTEKGGDEEKETEKQDEETQQKTEPCEKESVEDVVKQPEVVEEQITNGCVENIEKRIDRNQNSLLRVRIIDNQEVVLRHPEDYYDDSSTETYSIKQRIEQFESYRSSSPTSKIRQTILTKENLLGTE